MRSLGWKRPAFAVATALALGGVAPAWAGPQGMAPRPVLVSARHLTIRSSVGTFCTQSRPRANGTASSMCADYAYPLQTHGRLPVGAGDVVQLRFRHNTNIQDRIKAVHVSLLRVSGNDIQFVERAGHPSQNPHHASRWLFRLPADLHNSNVLDVSVAYPGGDGDFWAGITARG